ncbi:OLD family endonuclease [Endozoicomonas sp. (ex Bugula neritina AB1)]|nr:OLD family endonuclease [Endozoicomonas sp. (ex Bugula neritina AB1)]
MRMVKARVQNYRSIRDTGWFDVEKMKTILVGPNEAGKTAICMALQQINPPEGVDKLKPLRDFPRSVYNDINTGQIDINSVPVVEAHFALEPEDWTDLPEGFEDAVYCYRRYYDKIPEHYVTGGPEILSYGAIQKDLTRLCNHIDTQYKAPEGEESFDSLPSNALKSSVEELKATDSVSSEKAEQLIKELDEVLCWVDEDNEKEEKRFDEIKALLQREQERETALSILSEKLPVFVLYSNYFRVKPVLHLEHLATRLEQGLLDDDAYDYGNECLLKLLGFTARELSDQAKIDEPKKNDPAALQSYRDKKDARSYQLNSASVKLTSEVRTIWNPNPKSADADRLRISADGQYLKVTVEDDIGVEIELDQRSEGFQWIVSFFVVFFAEAIDKHKNAILLLDEPGVSLHGLKQRDFRHTVARLAGKNQVLYTTHSPFMVGPDELDFVRVVEMNSRTEGTKVNNTVIADDPAALLPLQEALGYDLAQSLFTQKKNLVLEGLTDLWFIDGVSQLAKDAGKVYLDEKIALLPAGTASKVTYFATILSAQDLKVAALLDSDTAGEQVAQQDTLKAILGTKALLRTKDFYDGEVVKSEIEDLLRVTLVKIARDDNTLAWDVSDKAEQQSGRPIVDLFNSEYKGVFSKYRLAKAFLRWSREHSFSDLSGAEQKQWEQLFTTINKALK